MTMTLFWKFTKSGSPPRRPNVSPNVPPNCSGSFRPVPVRVGML